MGGQDRAEGKRRRHPAQGRDGTKIQQSKHPCSWTSTRRSGRSDSMLEARVGNTSLNGSDTRHGRVAVVGETRRMVA